MKAGRELPKEKENFDRRYRQREDSKRMEGWVSGRGNKRGSKSRPGPGVANERAPAGSSKGVWASRDVTRSVTLPPLPPTINDATLRFPLYPAPFRPSGSFLCHPRFDPFELNRVLVPVLKGAAAVSATWQPCLYLAPFYTISRTLATSWLISFSLRFTIPPARLFVVSLFPSYLPPFSRSISFSLSGLCLLPFLSLGDINNAIAQASNFRADGSNNVWSAPSTKELRASCHRDRPAVNMVFESPFGDVRRKSR